MSDQDSANGIVASDPNASTYLAIWFFFQIAADHVCMPILVATFLFSKNVKRNPALINMCITWIIAGISSSLLLYAGKASGPEPRSSLCIFQAAMLEATPPMCSLSALALIYTVWTSVSFLDERVSQARKFVTYAMLVVPYAALVVFAVVTSLVALQDPRKVNRTRRFFYCSVENRPLSDSMGIFTAAACILGVFFEILIAIRIVRTWQAFKSYKPGHRSRGFDKHLIIRLFIFSAYLLVALVFSAASVHDVKSPAPDLFAASIGMAVFLVFGTRRDVVRTWAFWLPARPPAPPPKDNVAIFIPPHERLVDNHIATIFSETETLHDASHDILRSQRNVDHDHEHGNTLSSSGHAIPESRESLMSRKGDSVIFIGRPGDASRCSDRDDSANPT